jgi:hypothetical protein
MKRKMKISIIGLTAYAMTITVLGLSSNASASYREVHAGICHYQNDALGSSLDNRGELKNTGSTTRQVYCPMVSDSTLSLTAVDSLTVFGKEGTNGAKSRVCSVYVSGPSFTCGTYSNWSNNNGVVAPSVSVYEWNVNRRDTEFRYMRHDLTQNSSVYGMAMTQN